MVENTNIENGFFESNPLFETPKAKFDGNYVTTETGAKRSDRRGKGRYDLIPSRPLERVAKVYEDGAAVHGDWNWAKGFKMSRTLDSAERHIRQYLDGDRSEDHLAQAVWNLMATMWFEEHAPETNDLRNDKATRLPDGVYRNHLGVLMPKKNSTCEAEQGVPKDIDLVSGVRLDNGGLKQADEKEWLFRGEMLR
jgi:hypothetical protein